MADITALRFQNRQSLAFDALLTKLIEIEFDGQEPTVTVFASLKFYLNQNDIKHCQSPDIMLERNVRSDWVLIDDGLHSLRFSIQHHDAQTMSFAAASMRSVLESFYRFYSVERNESVDTMLITISRLLQLFSNEMSTDQLLKLIKTLSTELVKLKSELLQFEHTSFYSITVAEKYLKVL